MAGNELQSIYESLNAKFISRGRGSINTLSRLLNAGDAEAAVRECRYLMRKAEPPGATGVAAAAKLLLTCCATQAAPADVLAGKLDEVAVALDAFEQEASSHMQRKHSGNFFSDDVVVTNSEQIDLLSKQMASWNRAVYEERVTTKFLEEELVCKLQQRVQGRNAHIHRAHKLVCERNQRWCESLPTPYTLKKGRVARTLEAHRYAEADASPRFRDQEEVLTPRLQAERLASRGLPPNASRLARPVTPRTIAARVRADLPPLVSIMNPLGRVPEIVRHVDREELLEASGATALVGRRSRPPRAHANSKDEPRELSLAALLRMMSVSLAAWLEDTLTAHAPPALGTSSGTSGSASARSPRRAGTAATAAAHGGGPLLPTPRPLLQVVEDAMRHRHGHAAPIRIEEARRACLKRRGEHARVAVFGELCWVGSEGWGGGSAPSDDATGAVHAGRDPVRDAAFCWIMSWLQMVSADPPAKDEVILRRALLSMTHVGRLVAMLHSKALISARGVPALTELALGARVPAVELPPSASSSHSLIDVDEMLHQWMHAWGTWEDDALETEARAHALASVAASSATSALVRALPLPTASSSAPAATADVETGSEVGEEHHRDWAAPAEASAGEGSRVMPQPSWVV